MKTRNFIAKSITSIVNLDRYPNLINQILIDHLNSETNIGQMDNNKINGILELLNCLIDKHNIFKFIQFDLFMDKLEPLIEIKQYENISKKFF